MSNHPPREHAGFDVLISTLALEALHGIRPLLPNAAYGQDVALIAHLIDSLRAQIAKLEADQYMLSETIRLAVVALGDVPDDWEGSVAEGIDRINANIAVTQGRFERVLAELNRFYALFTSVEQADEISKAYRAAE